MAVRTEEVRAALLDLYRQPEWWLGFEVAPGGGSDATRHADAVAINCYPSRGYEVRGFEIKVSRSDLKRELDDGAKAEAVAKYCNYWFLLVPKGLTKDMQIPHNWGILEYDEETKKIRQKHKAAYREAIWEKGFACSFLRGVERMKEIDKALHYDELKEEMIREMGYQVRGRLEEADRMKANLKEIRDKTGLDLMYHRLTNWEISYLNVLMHLRDSDAMSIKRMIVLKSTLEKGIAALERTYRTLEEVTKDFEVKKESKNEV